MTSETPIQIQYDFSVLATEYFVSSKKEREFLQKEYVSHIRNSSLTYLEDYLEKEKLSIKRPIHLFSTLFNSKKKLQLVAAKIALYDLKHHLYSLTPQGLNPLCTLENRLDKDLFKRYVSSVVKI